MSTDDLVVLQDVRVRPQGWVEPGWVGAAEAEQWEQAQAARWADPHEQPQVSGPSSPRNRNFGIV